MRKIRKILYFAEGTDGTTGCMEKMGIAQYIKSSRRASVSLRAHPIQYASIYLT
jgi:hypothetical protein